MDSFVVVTYRQMRLFDKPLHNMFEPGTAYTFDTFQGATNEMMYQINSGNEAELWHFDTYERAWFRILFAGNDKHETTPVKIG